MKEHFSSFGEKGGSLTPLRAKQEQLALILKLNLTVKKWKKLTSKSKDRQSRLKQLVQTEYEYGKDLEKILKYIKQPLELTGIIDQEQSNRMFINMQAMLNLSKLIHKEMLNVYENWERRTTLIAQKMIGFSKPLLVYGDYLKNYSKTMIKIKTLLEENPEVKKIEKSLYVEISQDKTKIVTIQDMMGKPFQRPLKYQLLLRDYFNKTSEDHPDYPTLKKSLDVYREVNMRNNASMDDQEKTNILMILDKKFQNIIGSESRFYRDQFDGICIDMKVKVYILSDVIIISKNEKVQELYMKIYLDTHGSFIEKIDNCSYFQNRILICGKNNCINLTFLDSGTQKKVYEIIQQSIRDMQKNMFIRKEVISKNRESMGAKLLTTEQRTSYARLEPQLKKRVRILVVGFEKRQYSEGNYTTYFIVRVQLAEPEKLCQYLYVEAEELQKIETLVKENYPDFKFTSIFERHRSLSFDQFKNNEIKTLEYKSLLATQFLNLIFRNEEILKRNDIIAYRLKICEAFWDHITKKNKDCNCTTCADVNIIARMHNFNQEKRKRLVKKTDNPEKQFCQERTLHVQHMVAQLPAKEMQNLSLQERVIWLNCLTRRLDHSLLHQNTAGKSLCLSLNILSVDKNDIYMIQYKKDDKVRNVLDKIGKKLNLKIIKDYVLTLLVHGKFYLLDQDQLLSAVVNKEIKEEDLGFFTKIRGTFTKNQDFSFKFYLRKFYVLDLYTEIYACRENGERFHYIISEIIYRIKNQELILNQTQLYNICAIYYIRKHFHEFNKITTGNFKWNDLKDIIPDSKWFKVDRQFQNEVLAVVQKLKKRNDIESVEIISEFLMQTVNSIPGWNSYFFDVDYLDEPKRMKIGVDMNKIYIREPSKVTNRYEFELSALNYTVSSFLLTICEEKRQYRFYGRDTYNIQKAIQFYKLYKSMFIDVNAKK